MRRGLLGAVALVTGALAACSSGSSGPAVSGAPTPSTPSPSSPSQTAPSGVAHTATMRVSVVTGVSGRRVPVTDVSVAGGPASRVVVDTGSVGLLITASRVGSDARPTGRSVSRHYVGFALTGREMRAPVRFVDASGRPSTPAIGVGAVSGTLTPFLESIHAAGIMGVATGSDGAAAPQLPSPFASVPGAPGRGYVVDLPHDRVDLGEPSSTGALTIALTRLGWTSPNGLPGYRKSVDLTWTIGTAGHSTTKTLPTTFDTGGGEGIYGRALLPAGVVDGNRLREGTIVRAAAGGRPVVRYVAGSASAPSATVSPQLDVMNLGVGIFEHGRVGVDLARGSLLLYRQALTTRH